MAGQQSRHLYAIQDGCRCDPELSLVLCNTFLARAVLDKGKNDSFNFPVRAFRIWLGTNDVPVYVHVPHSIFSNG